MLLTGLVFFSHSSDSIDSKIAVEMTYRQSIIFIARRKIFVSKANCQGIFFKKSCRNNTISSSAARSSSTCGNKPGGILEI